MTLRGKLATLLLCLLLLNPFLSGINGDGEHHLYYLQKKVGFRIGSRKMLTLDAVLDYDYAGPNPKHDPRKGRPPGGRNP